MTTRYNPNAGTGRWYEDDEVEYEVVEQEINWWPARFIIIGSLVTAIFMSI